LEGCGYQVIPQGQYAISRIKFQVMCPIRRNSSRVFFEKEHFYLANLKLHFRFARMIKRNIGIEIKELLTEFPAVALLGPRQVGKTSLAKEIVRTTTPKSIYLDLESPTHLALLSEPESYFDLHQDKLIVLDEIHRVPELFAILRGVIDRNREAGHKTGQFLILGSASLDLIKQSSESLAGRIAYKELTGFGISEIDRIPDVDQNDLWLRGGFPDSLLSKSVDASFRWRSNFISTYLERDIPQFGFNLPANTLRRLWTMLAHSQGSQLNTAKIGASLDITSPTVKKYIELLEELLLIRTLRPWSGNVKKRLVKSPKVYIRDSGITHSLLSLKTLDDILGHPIAGASWEGYVIENVLSCLADGVAAWFYKTSAGAEIDLVIEYNWQKRIAIEIKKSLAPKISKGFYIGCEDINANQKFVIYPGNERFPLSKDVEVISLPKILEILR